VNDPQRLLIAAAGIFAGLTLAHVATFAAILASAATFVFMSLSALEKWETRKARRAAPPAPPPAVP
jgi:hypothetical protein